MKKALSIVLVVALVLGMSAVTALADSPPYSGEVHGIITVNETTGVISGTLEGAYDLTFTGQGYPPAGNISSFEGNFTGDFTGSVTGKMNVNGNDSLFAVITGTGASSTVYIAGGFPPCDINNYFEGKIVTGPLPAPVTDVVITTTEGVLTARVGDVLHMQLASPTGYEVRWGVWVDDRAAGYASIEQDGTLHILSKPADGDILVMANTLDPNVYTENITIQVVDPTTEVLAGVNPTYTIVIPAAVNFGTLVKDTGVVVMDFDITAQGVVVEPGASIDVDATGPFEMKDEDGTGSVPLAYTLENANGALTGNLFTVFEGDRTEAGKVKVNTAAITAAGSYTGTMVFTITYNAPV